jgi:hypothetical protein
MSGWSRLLGTAVIASAVGFGSGCDDDPTGPPPPGPPAQITVVSGGNQTATAGTMLPAPIVVKVTDSAGVALRGIAVDFTAQGGGSASAATTTDSLGMATAQWTLGTSTAQPQRLHVRVVHATAQPETTVSATATAGAAAASTRTGGDAQQGDIGQPLATPLSVRVNDQFGNPVPGVQVAWVVTSGGGSVSAGVQPTDSSGTSRVIWTLGSRLDVPQRVVAQAPVGGAITFTATPRLPTSATLTAVAGAPTSGVVGREIAAPFEVLLRLANGTPVEGATVNWSVVSGPATVSPTTTVTSTNGRAAARLTLGNTPGQVILAANVAGLPEVRFNVTSNADVPATVTIVGGNNQSAPVGTSLPLPQTVSVADRFGNLLTGANVAWTVTSGGGSVTPTTSTTDATGRTGTSWRLGNSAGTQTVTASVGTASATFTATAQGGAVTSITLSPATATLQPGNTQQITVVLRDQFGNVVTGRTPAFTSSDTLVATVSSAGLVTAIADGSAEITASIDGRSETVAITVFTPPSIPARPSNLEASELSTTSVALTWELNSTNATRLQIEYRQVGTTNWLEGPQLAGHVTAANVGGLEPQTDYEFRIYACNNLGCSQPSEPALGHTLLQLLLAALGAVAFRKTALR